MLKLVADFLLYINDNINLNLIGFRESAHGLRTHALTTRILHNNQTESTRTEHVECAENEKKKECRREIPNLFAFSSIIII